MQQTSTQLPEIKLIGIQIRTNNANEMTPTAKIGPTVQKYFDSTLFEKIPNRKTPGITYSAYTEYDSDYTGDYTFFIGEAVTSLDDLPEGFAALTIPAQRYAKLTNGPGPMPNVCINTWTKIWQMTPEELGGERNYVADFELYDVRAQDPSSTTLDVFYRDTNMTKDSNGTTLSDGDSVQLIKDLKVKGTSITLKRGTVIKNIRLTSDEEEVECRAEKVKDLVLKTCFLKKV